ncbi:MAG: hypothetical protein KUG65_05035 [Sphingomonadaceae bacterium]|nr:hypothetical protein [Sphingomonadaceae bacterium]
MRDWRALRDSDDIQFEPVAPIEPPEVPEWLQWLGEWLRDIFEPIGKALGMPWPTIQIVLIALGVLLALLVAWMVLRPLIERVMARGPAPQEEEWEPARDAAAALLEDADRLAQAGRYDEAVHLLLKRSVHHIAQGRPEWLHPASTAREIAQFPMLPEGARNAFSKIAVHVERSLFALHGLDETDWKAARAAYADFALAELPA